MGIFDKFKKDAAGAKTEVKTAEKEAAEKEGDILGDESNED